MRFRSARATLDRLDVSPGDVLVVTVPESGDEDLDIETADAAKYAVRTALAEAGLESVGVLAVCGEARFTVVRETAGGDGLARTGPIVTHSMTETPVDLAARIALDLRSAQLP